MIHVLIRHEVADYTAWKAVFDSNLDWRHKRGERSCHIFRSVEKANDLTLFFEWESPETARAFLASAELASKMAAAGVKGAPRIEILSEVHTLRRSSAD
jgi:hypothetical protein